MRFSLVPPWGILGAHLLAGVAHFRVATAEDTFPQQVQISLVFPRNETYDISSGVLPVIFAVTNTHYANYLRPAVLIRVVDSSVPNYDNSFESPTLDLLQLEQPSQFKETPTSITHSDDGGDTTYLHYAALNVSQHEGRWLLSYSVDVMGVVPGRNTIQSSESHVVSSGGSIIFSTVRGGGTKDANRDAKKEENSTSASGIVSLDAEGLVRSTASTECKDVPFSQTITMTDVVYNQTCNSVFEGRTYHVIDDTPIKQCPTLANDTQAIKSDKVYGMPDLFPDPPNVNMSSSGSGCAPALTAALASWISSMATNVMSCYGPRAANISEEAACYNLTHMNTTDTNTTNMASPPLTTSISVSYLAGLAIVVMGVATGVLSL